MKSSMDPARIRKNLVELLEGGHAHIPMDSTSLDLPRKYRTVRPPGMQHSAWELLEHMRLAQEDIIRYTLDADWESPPFPDGYWPDNPSGISDRQWNGAVNRFMADLQEVVSLANNPEVDLSSQIQHGEGRTYLRQVLLVVDHNSYHFGQFIQLKKALGLPV